MPTKAKKKPAPKSPPKYLYATTDRVTGEIYFRDDKDQMLCVDTSARGRRLGSGKTVKVRRYVLESSVRPGGR